MKGLFVLYLALTAVHAAKTSYKQIQFSNCDAKARIRVNALDVSPMPVGVPGEVEVSVDASVSRDIPGPASLQLKINQERLLFSPKIPCLGNVGSCKYDDVCTILDRMESENWLKLSRDVAVQLKAVIKDQLGITKMCPLAAGNYTINSAKIKLPNIPKILSMFATGDYAANVRVEDEAGTVMCLDLKLSVEDKGKLFPGK